MITASHNPIEWNALKFIGPTGLFLESRRGRRDARARSRRRHSARDVGRSWAPSTTDDRARSAPHRTCPGDPVHRRRRGFARGSFTWRSTACAAPAARSSRACSSGWAARCTRSISRPTDAFRARRSRCRKISASWNAWCSDAGAQIGLRGRSRRRPPGAGVGAGQGDRRGLHARARGACRAATPEGTRGDESLDEPGRRRRGAEAGQRTVIARRSAR